MEWHPTASEAREVSEQDEGFYDQEDKERAILYRILATITCKAMERKCSWQLNEELPKACIRWLRELGYTVEITKTLNIETYGAEDSCSDYEDYPLIRW